ncbi:hypothetical protein ES703_76001 [subsurface metagenome]
MDIGLPKKSTAGVSGVRCVVGSGKKARLCSPLTPGVLPGGILRHSNLPGWDTGLSPYHKP